MTPRRATPLIVLGNYPPDRQHSMLRVGREYARAFESLEAFTVETLSPVPVLGRFARGSAAKWAGYVDKLLLFRRRIRAAVATHRAAGLTPLVHIVDQGNAPWRAWASGAACTVTCHDVLAIRAAAGAFPGVRTRWTGRRQQELIRRHLLQFAHIAAVSEATAADLRQLGSRADIAVIPSPLGTQWHPPPAGTPPLPGDVTPPSPWILHVGGAHWYKNRSFLLPLFARLHGQGAVAGLLLVGPPLDLSGLPAAAASAVRRIDVADDALLQRLYASAAALVFPSLAEGFGLPVLEALACGGTVAAADIPPLREAGGDAAAYFDTSDPAAAADAVRRLLGEDAAARAHRRAAGLAHAARFGTGRFLSGYQRLFAGALLSTPP